MKLFISLLIWVPAVAVGQGSLKEVKPSEIIPLDLSNEAAERFEQKRQFVTEIYNKLEGGSKIEDLSPAEQRALNDVDEKENYWEIFGNSCSWYCGGGPESVTASSELKSQGANSYKADNAHDLNYKTAWVEGVAGYGIGQTLTYQFSPTSPRVLDIIVVNGYVKTEKAYRDNSRVRKLKVYLNDKPFAILILQDIRSNQIFKFDPIGNGNRTDIESLKIQAPWTLKFEILEVYKGLQYEDVAITEIYFDGIDVH